jgi:hypothetical protein
MKSNRSSALILAALGVASAMFADLARAGADELNDLRADQARINSRIDQIAKPSSPQTDDRPTLDTPTPGGTTAAGSFPRSFVIPGTDTSVRVGGFIDGTAGYRDR